MKKFTLLAIMVLAVTFAFGQKKERSNALKALKNKDYTTAIQLIDQTVNHPETMNDAKTWLDRGNIYLEAYASNPTAYPDALNTVYESFQKMSQLDEKNRLRTQAFQSKLLLSEHLFNYGVSNFEAGKYANAQRAFENSIVLNKEFNNVDTLLIFNAGLSAENAGNFDAATKHYTEVLNMGYPQPLIYVSLANMSMKQGDTIKALGQIQEGRTRFPEDFNLLITETNHYLSTGQNDKAMDNLQKAIVKDPNNPTIHYAVGVNYALMNQQDKAEQSYMKAVELKPDYFEPNYNLGALYVNQAAAIIDQANALPLTAEKEYNELKAKSDDLLRKSIPFLEKASQLEPTDANTLASLKEIYTRLQMNAELQNCNQRIENLK